jgi:alpha-1,2-mannosyltransferase
VRSRPGDSAAAVPGLSAAGPERPSRPRPQLWLGCGLAVFAVALGGYLAFAATVPLHYWSSPVDLNVYRQAGLIVRQMAPAYNRRLGSPLYGWPGIGGLRFTYPPFAALVFTVLTLVSWPALPDLSVGANILALLAAIWVTLGALGYRTGRVRVGGTLLIAGVVLWTEPVQRTLYLGQVELLLLALIMWDLCQPDQRWWKGAGVGVAAGLKLVPLIFIPYLLLTRRFRQAAVAAGTFAVTVGLGFAVLPADSRTWWLDGVFSRAGRAGFTGWVGNQSLQGTITRLAGSVAAGKPAWLAVAAVTLAVGLAAATLLDRAGHQVAGVLACALTGLLVSPVSWDHHWVWIVPAITVLAVYGVRARGALRWAYLSGAGLAAVLFGAWPDFLWGQRLDLKGFWLGFIWAAPSVRPGTFSRLGDRPWYPEYHWRGLEVVAGNLYLLAGLAAFALIVALAVRSRAAAD